jgi:Uri superfamily endonuclease
MVIVPGVYQLRIRLKRSRPIRVGALGKHPFPAGWYVYTGSARNGLAQRVGRHLRHSKQKRWHIDYLLAVADQVEAFVLPGEKLTECELHTHLLGGQVIVPGFGASDCGCEAHLTSFKKKPGILLTSWHQFVRDCIPY